MNVKRNATQEGSGAVALHWRDHVFAATLVLILLAAQTWWMGRAVILLSGGLVIACGVWAFARWKDDATVVLPVYLLAIAVQCLHFTEEYMTGFQREFPSLMGSQWSDARFVTFNMIWLAVFVLAGVVFIGGNGWRISSSFSWHSSEAWETA